MIHAHFAQGTANKLPFADKTFQTVVTSPPYYGLRNYHIPDDQPQIGLEPTLDEYIYRLADVFDEVWRVLRDNGTLWLNMGDSYAKAAMRGKSPLDGWGSNRQDQAWSDRHIPRKFNTIQASGLKRKDLMGVPWRLALELQNRGWFLRCDIIWSKTNPMPESVKDRPTRSHEYIFLMTKNGPNYYWIHSKTGEMVFSPPEPDYRWIRETEFGTMTVDREIPGMMTVDGENPWMMDDEWERVNLWQGHSYYYDHFAIREPVTGGAHPHGSGHGTKVVEPGLGIKNNSSFRESTHVETESDMWTSKNARSVWTMNTRAFPGAHFATFPPELPEQCIKAGTSEKGECPVCGAPWVRVLDVRKVDKHDPENQTLGAGRGDWADRTKHAASREPMMKGWEPTCTHDADPIPQKVLDPFSGTGTTAAIAQQLGRVGYGLDLSMKYIRMSHDRSGQTKFNEWMNGKSSGKDDLDGLPLFNERK